MSTPIKFAQISDTHVYGNANAVLLGVNTRESFDAVVDLLKQENDLDFILHTGDISQDGTPASYQYVANRLSELNLPVYYVPGNHDHLKVMREMYPSQKLLENKNIVLDHFQLILLDTHVHGKVAGALHRDQFDFMFACLNAHPTKHAILVFHHHPFDVGTDWLKPIGLTNSEELFTSLKPYTQVKHIIFAHVHQEIAKKIHGIQTFSAPSTCIQFKPNQKEFALDHLPPGCAVYQLFDDGRVEREIKRVSHYVGEFMQDAKGY